MNFLNFFANIFNYFFFWKFCMFRETFVFCTIYILFSKFSHSFREIFALFCTIFSPKFSHFFAKFSYYFFVKFSHFLFLRKFSRGNEVQKWSKMVALNDFSFSLETLINIRVANKGWEDRKHIKCDDPMVKLYILP